MDKTTGANEVVPQTTPTSVQTTEVNEVVPQTTSSSDENLKGALCYSLGFVSGIIFLLIEKENKFIRFHAMQSIVTFLGIAVLMMVPIIGWALSVIVTPLSLILWAVLMYKAYQGEMFKLPVVGDFAEKQTQK